MFAMDPEGVRRLAAGVEEPAAAARHAADRLAQVRVPLGDPDLSAGAAVAGLLDLESDGLRALAVELGLLQDRADACAASVTAAEVLAERRYQQRTSPALREALG